MLGWEEEEQLLRQVLPDREVLDSGCCGMAGSFGYEADKFELSMKVGERRLLPRVREADRETLVVTDGFSCHGQIAAGAGREALHVAQVLQMALRQQWPEPRASRIATRRLRVRRALRISALAGIGALSLLWLVRSGSRGAS